MMRSLLCTLALSLAGACAPSKPIENSSVDINAAATQAQGTIDAYGANVAEDAAVDSPEPDAAEPKSANAGAASAPLDPPAPGTPGGLPDDRTPVSEAPSMPDTAQGAATVVETYYALIGEGKYARAFGLLDDGAGAKTPAAFAADFARYSDYHATVGAPGAIDAGAGQRYVTVPVQVYARLRKGGVPVYQHGQVTLHRTGDIDGATTAQRSWRIRTIDLKPAPAPQHAP